MPGSAALPGSAWVALLGNTALADTSLWNEPGSSQNQVQSNARWGERCFLLLARLPISKEINFFFFLLVVNFNFQMHCEVKSNWKHINERVPKTVFHLASPHSAEHVCLLRDLISHHIVPGTKLPRSVLQGMKSPNFIPAWPPPMWPFMNTPESLLQAQLMLRELFGTFSNSC